LPVSELLHHRIIGGTFNAAVPAAVVIRAVTVVFAVCFVVLLIVRDEIVQCEAVMTGHKVHTLLDLAFFMPVNCRATEQAVSEASDRSLFPTKKAPDIVSEPSVPLPPTVPDEAADFVEASRVPRLGDKLGPGECGVRFNVPQYRRSRHHLA